ncbi:MAG: VanZ family protein [bacterium]
MKRLLLYQFPPVLWLLCIVVLSTIRITPRIQTPIAPDKLAHAGMFFVLSLLIYRSFFHQERFKFLKRHAILAAFLFTVVYGILDELYQLYIPWRTADVFDAIADTIGAFLFSFFIIIWCWLKKFERFSRVLKYQVSPVLGIACILATPALHIKIVEWNMPFSIQKAIDIVLYFFLAYLLQRAFYHQSVSKFLSRHSIVFSFLMTILISAASMLYLKESLQPLLRMRNHVASIGGGLLFSLLWYGWIRLKMLLEHKQENSLT